MRSVPPRHLEYARSLAAAWRGQIDAPLHASAGTKAPKKAR
jgi:hypothetical protein